MEDERNTQLHQGEETQGEKAADQVEVRDRGVLDSLLGRKKPEKKPEDELVTGMENVKVSEPTEKHEEVKKEEHHEGGEKKESLLSKLHRSSSSSSSSSSDEEEVIDENGEKRKKKKDLKEKVKEKLPGHKEGEQKPHAPLASEHKEAEEHKPYTPNDDHKAYIPTSAPATTTGTTANVHHKDNAVVIQNLEETPQKGLMEKIKEKLPGGHKKTAEEVAATEQDVSSPDAKEKKQGFLGKIMDKIPGYNKGAAEEEHKPATTAAAGEHKASS